MDEDDFAEHLKVIQKQTLEILDRLEMTRTLFYEVVERTQNFREGWYSQRRLDDLSKSAARALQRDQLMATTPADMVTISENFINDMNNILATMLTEIDRIDE